MTHIEMLEQRISALESRSRRRCAWPAIIAIGCIACASVASGPAGSANPEDQLIAKEVIIKNDDGQVVARLGSNTSGGGLLYLAHASGEHSVIASNGFLMICDEAGRSLVSIGSTKLGDSGAVQIFNPENDKYFATLWGGNALNETSGGMAGALILYDDTGSPSLSCFGDSVGGRIAAIRRNGTDRGVWPSK